LHRDGDLGCHRWTRHADRTDYRRSRCERRQDAFYCLVCRILAVLSRSHLRSGALVVAPRHRWLVSAEACMSSLNVQGDSGLAHFKQSGKIDVTHGQILYLEDVQVSFDGFRALRGLSLMVADKELRCIIGPNGAGKT